MPIFAMNYLENNHQVLFIFISLSITFAYIIGPSLAPSLFPSYTTNLLFIQVIHTTLTYIRLFFTVAISLLPLLCYQSRTPQANQTCCSLINILPSYLQVPALLFL